MVYLLLNTLALDPHRWTPEKVGYYRLEALLEPIAEAGFHGVELWQYHLCRESKAEVQQLRTKAEALGVRFPVVGMYPQLHRDGTSRRKAWDEPPPAALNPANSSARPASAVTTWYDHLVDAVRETNCSARSPSTCAVSVAAISPPNLRQA